MIHDFESFLNENRKGLWHNIRAKRARGEKPARKGSKAYKKAVAAAKKINETYKSIGLGDPRPIDFLPRVNYEMTPKIAKMYYSDHDMTADEVAIHVANDLKLDKGEIFISEDEFIVSGITKGGNVIYIEQYGEYSMYGGPYDPKMQEPKVIVNGKDRSKFIIDFFRKEDDGTQLSPVSKKKDSDYTSNFPDFSRTDVYGSFLDKPDHFWASKKYGL